MKEQYSMVKSLLFCKLNLDDFGPSCLTVKLIVKNA